jgi:hypothetical protein
MEPKVSWDGTFSRISTGDAGSAVLDGVALAVAK